jgi:hypothetical protein
MTKLEVLVKGGSDLPAVREVLTRRFGLVEGDDFRLYPHHGKGSLPRDLLSPPPPQRRGLLDQLPVKLRGLSNLGLDACVIVLVDSDQQSCIDLLADLNGMLARLPKRPPRVLFRIAVEETEIWFIADLRALSRAFPRAKLAHVRRIPPDAAVGAWEQLAGAIGVAERDVTGVTKSQRATKIAPHLDLDAPASPSLRKFLIGVERTLAPVRP